MREGFAYVFGNPWPRAVMTVIATFAVFGFSFMTMMPVFARDALHLDAAGYGTLVSAVGVGAAGGAFFMAGMGGRTRRARLVLGSSVLFGLVLTAAALAPNFWTAFVLFTLAGCLMALNGIAANTMLQTQAPDHLRGRIMGFYSFVVLGMAPFGSLEAGWIAEHYGVRTAVGSGGLVCLVVAWGVAWRMERRKDGRTQGPEQPPGDRTAERTEERADSRSSGVLGGQPAASEEAGQTGTEWSEEDGVGPSLRSG